MLQEYEAQSSPEAKFVKELDRFDMIQQAFEYEKRECKPGFLQEFFTAVEGKFSHPLVTGLLDELNKQRSEFQSSKITNGTKENNST